MKITPAEITQAVDLAATLATALGPQAAALIALGRVVATAPDRASVARALIKAARWRKD